MENCRRLIGISLKQPVIYYGLRIEPDGDEAVLICRPEEMGQRRFDRQCHVLMGYICLALGGLPEWWRIVPWEELALPPQEDWRAPAATWFEIACRQERPEMVAMAVYNGLGALKGSLLAGKEWLFGEIGPQMGERFETLLAWARRDEDDSGCVPAPLPPKGEWTEEELHCLRQALFKACRSEKA